jgi:hypothetical protein
LAAGAVDCLDLLYRDRNLVGVAFQRDRETSLIRLDLKIELQLASQLVDEVYLVSCSREGED